MSSGFPKEVAAAPPEARFGKFVRTRKLGSGGMGEVWQAWDTELNRWVALKFLKGGDDREIELFKREAQTAGRLNHPNIAAIYEVGLAHGRHYIAMQFVDGQTLHQYPRGDRKILVQMIRDAAMAVQFAHDQGIVHRDLKPDNLMVLTRGQHIYVMDFGLARPAEGASGMSVSGFVVGTPTYMSPEQARGEKVDRRGDVYSLGATLYELLTGRKPFHSANPIETINKVLGADVTPPRSINPKIDADLETIVLKCLEKDRRRRYSSAAKLADDLGRWIIGDPIDARPPSTLYRLRRSLRRHATVAIAATCVVVAVLVVLAMTPRKPAEVGGLVAEARKLETDGRIRDAWAKFDAVLKLDPRNEEAGGGFRRTGAVLDRWKKFDPVLEDCTKRLGELESAQQLNPRADFANLLVQIAGVRGDLERAMQAALERADAHSLLARCWTMEGYPEKAEDAWREALRRDPTLRDARFRLGRHLLSQAFLAKKSQSWSEADSTTPESQRLAEEGTREIQEWIKLGGGSDADLQKTIASAMVEYSNGRVEAVLKLTREALIRLKGKSGIEELHWLQGLASAEHSEEIECHTRALDGRPGFVLAAISRGIALSLSRRFKEAKEDFETAIRVNPRSAEAYYGRAAVTRAMGNSAASIADFTESIRLKPSFPHAWAAMGQAYEEIGKFDDALRVYDEAIKLNPNLWFAILQRARIHGKAGRIDQSKENYERLVGMKPKTGLEFLYRGQALRECGRLDEAIEALTKAIQMGGIAENGYYWRAQARGEKGDVKGAMEDLDETLKISPDRAGPLFIRAGYYLQMRRFEEAYADYKHAAENNPNYTEAWFCRGITEIKTGRIREGIESLQHALDVALPNWPKRAMAEGEIARAKALLTK